jgi:hypothetical protein
LRSKGGVPMHERKPSPHQMVVCWPPSPTAGAIRPRAPTSANIDFDHIPHKPDLLVDKPLDLLDAMSTVLTGIVRGLRQLALFSKPIYRASGGASPSAGRRHRKPSGIIKALRETESGIAGAQPGKG